MCMKPPARRLDRTRSNRSSTALQNADLLYSALTEQLEREAEGAYASAVRAEGMAGVEQGVREPRM
jgi:hypothetical protein